MSRDLRRDSLALELCKSFWKPGTGSQMEWAIPTQLYFLQNVDSFKTPTSNDIPRPSGDNNGLY